MPRYPTELICMGTHITQLHSIYIFIVLQCKLNNSVACPLKINFENKQYMKAHTLSYTELISACHY